MNKNLYKISGALLAIQFVFTVYYVLQTKLYIFPLVALATSSRGEEMIFLTISILVSFLLLLISIIGLFILKRWSIITLSVFVASLMIEFALFLNFLNAEISWDMGEELPFAIIIKFGWPIIIDLVIVTALIINWRRTKIV